MSTKSEKLELAYKILTSLIEEAYKNPGLFREDITKTFRSIRYNPQDDGKGIIVEERNFSYTFSIIRGDFFFVVEKNFSVTAYFFRTRIALLFEDLKNAIKTGNDRLRHSEFIDELEKILPNIKTDYIEDALKKT